MEKLMSQTKSRLIIYLTPLLAILVVAFIWLQAIKPAIVNYVKSQIPKANSSQKIVNIKINDFDISILKLQVSVIGLYVEFVDPKLILKPINVGRIDAQLDLFNLIIGIPKVSKLVIDNAEASFDIPEDNSNDPLPEIPIDKIFSDKENIPINHLIITNSNVTLTHPKLSSKIQIKLQQTRLSNLKNKIELVLAPLELALVDPNQSPIVATISFDSSLTPSSLNIETLQINVLNSQLKASAVFDQYKTLLRSPIGSAQFSSLLNLDDIRNIALMLFPQKNRIPTISGKIDSSGKVTLNSFKNISGNIDFSTTQVAFDHFKLGQVSAVATISKNQVLFNEINIEHTAGKIKLNDIRIEQKSPFQFSSKIDFKNFELQKLFQAIGLVEIPAGLNATGGALCEGLLSPKPFVNCSFETQFSDVWAKSSLKDSSYIVKLKQGQLRGEVKVDSEKVNYHANINLGSESTGTSHGEIGYSTGFNIHYESNNLNFKDVETLAGLDFKGIVKIIGNTSGDSHHGLINANVSASNAEIEKFRLGAFSTTLSYKDSQLNFSNYIGVIGKTDLAGQLNFNFKESSLSANINSKNIQGEDILFILNQKFELPFNLNGQGTARINVNGPFDFWKLSYNLDTELKQGAIAGERFESLTAKLVSDGKKIDFTDVRLKKIKSSLLIDGAILTDSAKPQFDLKLKLNPLQLEESDYVLRYAPSIAGTGYSDGTITGPLSAPNLNTNITLKQVTYEKIEYPNSQGRLQINNKNFSFNGQFFGRQIQTDVVWPWNERDPFYAKVLVQDLNPLFLLPLISLPQPGSDFYSRLNAEIDLSGRTPILSQADGYIKISDFLIQRGNQSLKLTKPTSLLFKSGLKQMEELVLAGEDSHLKLRMDNTTSNRVKVNVDADLQLRLFQFLVPFAQTLSGYLSVNSQFIFKESEFELLGEGDISDGLIGLKGFPQPIQKIHAPIEFSKSKIILSDIIGQLGTSDVTGYGQVEILGSNNIAVQLRAIADSVQLEFPTKVMTQGKATVMFSGNKLPYNLKVDYKVNQGLVENDFEPDPKQSLTLKASSFLPPQQVQLLSPSLALDVNIDLTSGVLIKNKLLEGEAKGNLQVQGAPEQPILIGKINIEPGSKLIFKDKPFEIQSAAIQFQGTKEINPDIYISASSRVSDYDISLLVQGLAKNLTITPTSQPPLSQNDIFTLLALGVTNENQNLSSDTQQRQTGLEVLAAISNQSQLNKKIQEKLGLTLQLAPSIDSTKNIAVPKVVVSKKINKKINASYSKPFTGNDQNQEVKLQYLYNNNVSFQLNYQNIDTTEQDQITNSNNKNKSILGLDLEFRDEFK
jgi:translocation and assembly module TamB